MSLIASSFVSCWSEAELNRSDGRVRAPRRASRNGADVIGYALGESGTPRWLGSLIGWVWAGAMRARARAAQILVPFVLLVSASCEDQTTRDRGSAESEQRSCGSPPATIDVSEFSGPTSRLNSSGEFHHLVVTFEDHSSSQAHFSSINGSPDTDIMEDLEIHEINFGDQQIAVSFASVSARTAAVCWFDDPTLKSEWRIVEVAPAEVVD